MGVLSKLFTLGRGAARESAEVLLDANAIRIFEQEIVDVEQTIHLKKQAMSEMLVARKQIEREIASVTSMAQKREAQAKELLQEDSTMLIDDIAVDIVQYQNMLDELERQRQTLSTRINKTEAALHKGLGEVAQYRRDLRLAKAKQINTSVLAKESNLPRQLSELEQTRQHVAGLQAGEDDRECAWQEMQDRVSQNDVDQAFKQREQAQKKAAVLARLKQSVER